MNEFDAVILLHIEAVWGVRDDRLNTCYGTDREQLGKPCYQSQQRIPFSKNLNFKPSYYLPIIVILCIYIYMYIYICIYDLRITELRIYYIYIIICIV